PRVTYRTPRSLRSASTASGSPWGARGRSGASSSSERIVSTESGLLVPIRPDGPRLIQPVTYSPTTNSPLQCTRPEEFGTTHARVSNGTSGKGSPLYPTDRSTI